MNKEGFAGIKRDPSAGGSRLLASICLEGKICISPEIFQTKWRMSSSGKLVTHASCGPGVHHLSLRVVNNTITLIKKESRHASQPVTEAARDLSHDLASIFWDCSSHGHFCLLGFTASPGQASTQRRGRGVRNGARGESVDGAHLRAPPMRN